MNADELLLAWAQEKAPEWLEEQVRHYNNIRGIPQINTLGHMANKIKGATVEHILHCGPKIYAIPNHEWSCGCYSEYTRDDSWVVHAYIRCAHGIVAEMVKELSPWSMPEVIQELADLDEKCMYDDPDY